MLTGPQESPPGRGQAGVCADSWQKGSWTLQVNTRRVAEWACVSQGVPAATRWQSAHLSSLMLPALRALRQPLTVEHTEERSTVHARGLCSIGVE